jgi:flagellar hook-associated protein 3 FlgL
MASSDAGDSVFMLVRNGNGQFRTGLDSGNTGSGTIAVGSVTNLTEFQSDFMGGSHPYTLQFAVDTTDPLNPVTTYEIRDSASNLVDPPGLGNPYTAGATIAFNGIEVAVGGQPADGDRFIIKPAEHQSLFATLDQLIVALGLPDQSAADVAKLTQALDCALTDLDRGLLNLNQARGRIGSRMNALDAQDEVNRNFNVQLQKWQAEIGAVDYAEAASRLNQELLALQASQQSFVKIQNLSLFDYLR